MARLNRPHAQEFLRASHLTSTLALVLLLAPAAGQRVTAQPTTFAGNAQHTAVYDPAAQHLNAIHWSTSIDRTNTGAYVHYGAPVLTPGNTLLTPVRIAAGFQINAFDATTGRPKYTLPSGFIPVPIASNGWVAAYQPVIATPPSGPRLYYPGAGGTLWYLDNPDGDIPGAPVQQCFYTNLAGYMSNAAAFNSAVFINTPLTADTNGVVFFGFRLDGIAPAPLNTTNGGFARVDPMGNAVYVLAGPAANDSRIYRDSHNCAPALSNDGSTLYVAVKSASSSYAYLLGLDSTTLATKFRAALLDPRTHDRAQVTDDGTASPTVAPDGDVYFGVLGNPQNTSRGFLLRFSADLQSEKPPAAFGWDYTPAIVPASMVPGYSGTSSYLIFSKYNNYAGYGDGNGINRIALLDPNATQLDPHPSATNLVEMREVLTMIGPTPDAEYLGTTYPYAVREWCINTAAINPATKSIFTPSEDGRIYRWDLAANALTEALTLGPGLGEPYIPTVVGPDGTVFSLNGGKLFALGNPTNLAVGVYSSIPDSRSVVAGQPLSFTAVVTNLDGGPPPTGTVTFLDVTYRSLTPVTNTLATAVPLANGMATVTTSVLLAASNYLGSHFITAKYSGGTNYSAASATLVQKVHAYASSLALTSAPSGTNGVVCTATVSGVPPGSVKPSGQVAFWDGDTLLTQVPLNTNGTATVTRTNWASGSHHLTATYASDTLFALSGGGMVPVPPMLTDLTLVSNGWFFLAFSNTIGAPFTVLATTDASMPLSNWPALGPAIEVAPGQFQFTDAQAAGPSQTFYRVRSP
jgi:hypothetical protein